jgi:hypothetical protein
MDPLMSSCHPSSKQMNEGARKVFEFLAFRNQNDPVASTARKAIMQDLDDHFEHGLCSFHYSTMIELSIADGFIEDGPNGLKLTRKGMSKLFRPIRTKWNEIREMMSDELIGGLIGLAGIILGFVLGKL